MKVPNKLPNSFFNKYSDKPVKLMPYNPEMTALANKYIGLVHKTLKELDVQIKIIGSVAYKIPTTDVEIAVYVQKKDWNKVSKLLEKEFNKPAYLKEEFALFPIHGEKYDFDIHVYTGYEGIVSKKLRKYMLNNRDMIKKYSDLKSRFSRSEREYQKNKNKFLIEIKEKIPPKY